MRYFPVRFAVVDTQLDMPLLPPPPLPVAVGTGASGPRPRDGLDGVLREGGEAGVTAWPGPARAWPAGGGRGGKGRAPSGTETEYCCLRHADFPDRQQVALLSWPDPQLPATRFWPGLKALKSATRLVVCRPGLEGPRPSFVPLQHKRGKASACSEKKNKTGNLVAFYLQRV